MTDIPQQTEQQTWTANKNYYSFNLCNTTYVNGKGPIIGGEGYIPPSDRIVCYLETKIRLLLTFIDM